MSQYGIELNEKIKPFQCPHCGEESMTVWGWVSKADAVHAVYYANLMTGHQEASARLTISIGGWGEEDNLAKRTWVLIEARPIGESYEMMVREPEESLYNGETMLGRPLARTAALNSPMKDEFFAVADFIAFNDPAVKSYLLGHEVSAEGRPKIH